MMNKNTVLELMEEYKDRRSTYIYYKESAAEYISINFEDDVEGCFIDAADKLLINLIWSLNTNIKKRFIESCLNVGMFFYDIDKDVLSTANIIELK